MRSNPRFRTMPLFTFLIQLTGPSLCSSVTERVYITALGCEIGFGVEPKGYRSPTPAAEAALSEWMRVESRRCVGVLVLSSTN